MLAAIIIIGGTGLYFSSIMTVPPMPPTSVHKQTQPSIKPTQTPSSFPYQFGKNVFDQSTFPMVTSNVPIKFESTQEIADFLKQSQKMQQLALTDQNSNRMVLSLPFGSGSPVTEPRPTPVPMKSSPESLQLGRSAGDFAHGTDEWNSGGEIPLHVGDPDSNTGSSDYSTTNVQVENVDEPDYLKTDGKYIYVASQNTISIIDAYPPENAKLMLRFALDINQQNIENMFLNGNSLVIIYYGTAESQMILEYDYKPYPVFNSKTVISVIDISDKQHPHLVSTHQVDGNYNNARMIGNTVYVVSVNSADYSNLIVPSVMSNTELIHPDVYRFPNTEKGYQFNTVTAVDVSGNLKNSETFLMGYTNTIYVSEKNLYITYQKNISPSDYDSLQKQRFFDVIMSLLSQDTQDKVKSIQNDLSLDAREKWRQVSKILQDTYNSMSKADKDSLIEKMSLAVAEYDSNFQNDSRRTVIHKIALDDGKLDYVANNDVSGYLLNQFSMDEHSGMFRIATTSETYLPNRTVLSNNVYVLDDSLKIVGKLDKIAPDERIYSARFMGDKLYLVTFRQMDPFFVIDLSNNTPKVLGELKIPGFSNYLQPYDENHIIGIGRDTKQNSWGGVEQKGIKVSMFDVTNISKPKEIDSIVIGDSGTYSDALDNHKALLLDKSKGVLSIPIKTNVASIKPQSQIQNSDYAKNWHGFYVYSIGSQGFTEKGQILHYSWQSNYNGQNMSPRSFYIGDYLYTVMDGSMKINDIKSLGEINSIRIQQTGNIIPFVNDFD